MCGAAGVENHWTDGHRPGCHRRTQRADAGEHRHLARSRLDLVVVVLVEPDGGATAPVRGPDQGPHAACVVLLASRITGPTAIGRDATAVRSGLMRANT